MAQAHDGGDWRSNLQKLGERLRATPEERDRAQVAINCFRQGSPPQERIEDCTIGLTDLLPVFDRELQRSKDGGCCLTLLHGPYGAGKSHALYVLRARALARGFLVSMLTLTQRECPLSDLGIVYSQVVRHIQGTAAGRITSVHDLLESWVDRVRKQGVTSLEKSQRLIRALHPDFQVVLARYLDRSSAEDAALAEGWITGTDPSRSTAKRLGVTLSATNEHGLQMMKELGTLVRSMGFAGLVVLLDEAEAIPSYTKLSSQALCYENLCRMMDRRERVPGCYFVYSTTPAFFERAGAIPLTTSSEEVHSLRTLNPGEALELGKLIRDLYLVGEGTQGWQSSIDDGQVKGCVAKCRVPPKTGIRPRAFVRSLVACLDICACNPRHKLAGIFEWCDHG